MVHFIRMILSWKRRGLPSLLWELQICRLQQGKLDGLILCLKRLKSALWQSVSVDAAFVMLQTKKINHLGTV